MCSFCCSFKIRVHAINGGHFRAGVGATHTSLDSGISTIMTTQRHVTNALHSGNVRLAGAFLRLYCLSRRQSDPETSSAGDGRLRTCSCEHMCFRINRSVLDRLMLITHRQTDRQTVSSEQAAHCMQCSLSPGRAEHTKCIHYRRTARKTEFAACINNTPVVYSSVEKFTPISFVKLPRVRPSTGQQFLFYASANVSMRRALCFRVDRPAVRAFIRPVVVR